MSTETEIVRLILSSLPRLVPGLALWRNNTGRRGRVTFGLGVGSADIVGVLAPTGRFVALEIKRPGGSAARAEQESWLQAVRDRGGFAAVVRSGAEALAAVRRAQAGEDR